MSDNMYVILPKKAYCETVVIEGQEVKLHWSNSEPIMVLLIRKNGVWTYFSQEDVQAPYNETQRQEASHRLLSELQRHESTNFAKFNTKAMAHLNFTSVIQIVMDPGQNAKQWLRQIAAKYRGRVKVTKIAIPPIPSFV